MNTSYLKGKVDGFEIYSVKTKGLNIEISKNEIDFATEGESEAIAVTVLKDKKIGFAFTTNAERFKETVDKAISTARANSLDKDFKGFVKPQRVHRIKNYSDELLDYSLKDFTGFHKAFMKQMHAAENRIMLSNAYFSIGSNTTKIINSEGVDLEETAALNSFSYEMTINKNGELVAAAGSKGDTKLIENTIADEAARRTIALLGKKPVRTTECAAVLHPEALAELLSKTLLPNINAENVQQGRSIFKTLNKKILSEKLTITDDATTKGMIATSSFDCEGTPSQRNTVINKGVLKTFLHNNYTARKEGKKSTGNASRAYFTLPSVGANNVIIEEGRDKEISSSIKKGVYIRELLGVHTMNALTGDFSLGLLEGFYIENGKVKYPIKNAMVAGNVYDMLNNITAVGSKAEHAFTGHGAFYLPEITVGKIKLIGKN